MRITAEIENKIEELISSMTLEEKVAMCHANSKFTSSGVERFGIEELTMSDGPHGVRPEVARDSWECLNRPEDDCTYLPTGTALAATWNPKLGRIFGETLGSEARYRQKDIILGPGVNIIRTPLCGRNFEYMSEDPCLIEKMAPNVVKGIESQDTAACVKHYALNNQELDRSKVNVEVSRRALHEIYLKGFYAAIIEGGASSVMGAYNRYLNQHCCHNDYLVNKVLKDKWGFKGVYLSDWAGVHDTDEAIANGMDIEMGTSKPYNEYYLADAFLEKAEKDPEVVALLDDKVRRILRLMFSVKKGDPARNVGEFNTKAHQQVAYNVAAEAMVLLKNQDNLLPIDKSQIKKLLVVGPNANVKHSPGGSSSGIHAFYEVTPLEGIKNRLGDLCEIEYISGDFDLSFNPIPTQEMNIADHNAGARGCKITAYRDGKADTTISNFAHIENGTAECYDLEVSVCIPEDGIYSLEFATTGDATVKIDDGETIRLNREPWNPKTVVEDSLACQKGQNVSFNCHIDKKGDSNIDFSIKWLTPKDFEGSSSESELLAKAAAADCVVYCGGIDHSFDTEGCDKCTMMLPAEQDVIIPKLIDANPNTIVTITAGSPVAMPWLQKARAVLWTWYGGMEGGNVLCDILTGAICPSGKMPFTLPRDYADTPVARYGEYKADNCKYNEDIFVGYRGFDKDNIEPLFPFGHGLSYSKFEYSDLSVEAKENGAVVSFTVKNVGSVTAKETAQVYIGDPECSVARPIKELRNFQKVELKPQESTEISFEITQRDLSFFDEQTEDWKLEKGVFTVFVGSSSRDIRLKGEFKIK